MIVKWTDKETKEVPGAGVLVPERVYDLEDSLADALIEQGQAKKSTSKALSDQEQEDKKAQEQEDKKDKEQEDKKDKEQEDKKDKDKEE